MDYIYNADGTLKYSSAAADPNNPTAAEAQAVDDFRSATATTAATAEATRLAKRPKRSQINSLKSKANNDNSNAATKETVKLLIDMMTRIIEFQKVDVEEDVK